MKSLEFLKPTLATTLAIVLAWLLSVRPAQAGYTVTLQQVGPDVVATGSGALDLTGLTPAGGFPTTHIGSLITSSLRAILTGPTSGPVDTYQGGGLGHFPLFFGLGAITYANGGSGDLVGIIVLIDDVGRFQQQALAVPTGYVSGTALSDSATYSGRTIASLGVAPGTHVWTWGTGANQNFTLQIPTPTPCPSATPLPASQAQLLNISARMDVKTGDNLLIGGFIVTGNVAKKVILRAIGPSLAPGVVGALADPVLELHASDGSLITSNDNWRSDQEAEIIASTIPPTDDLESAIVATLDPGTYTAIVNGKNGTSGVGLVECYDLDQPADAQLANVSARGLVETDSNVMIGGFILGNGTGTTNVVIRALGPSLPVAGIMPDPTLELHDANGDIVMSNDNWKDTQQCELEATGIPPQDDLESAMVVTVPTGAYTAIVAGKDDATGVALVEVYRIP